MAAGTGTRAERRGAVQKRPFMIGPNYLAWTAAKGHTMDANARSMHLIDSVERDQRALGLPDLEGSSLTTLAAIARRNIIRDARIYFFGVSTPAMTAGEFEARFVTPARRIVSADWWIEQCDAHPEAILADLESRTA